MSHMIEKHFNREPLARESASFMDAYDAVRCTRMMKIVSPALMAERVQRLRRALAAHAVSRLDAYGEDAFMPKNHYNMHTPAQVEKDGRLYDMFLLERHHKQVKHMAEQITNLATFERSLLSSATSAHLASLKQPATNLLPGLKGETQTYSGIDGVVVARPLVDERGSIFTVGDFVHSGGEVAKVVAALREQEKLGLCVEIFQALEESRFSGRYRTTDTTGMWDTDGVALAPAWYFDGEIVVVLR
jgi:hypothetical protein